MSTWVILRVILGAASLILFGTVFVMPVVNRATWPAQRSRTEVRLQAIWQALDAYAKAYSGHLPPAQRWADALTPFWARDDRRAAARWSDDFVFLEGVTNWFTGLEPNDVIVLDSQPGPDKGHLVLTGAGRVEYRSQAEVYRLMEGYGGGTPPSGR